MADATYTAITRGQLTSIITPTTKRFALVFDGQTVELGSTGFRDVSAHLDAGKLQGVAAGQLEVIRDKSTVTAKGAVTFANSAAGEGNVQFTKTGLGSAFAPPENKFFKLPDGVLGITTAGNLYLNPATRGSLFRFEVTYVVDRPWPATLPGVPKGEPVVFA